MVPLMRLIHCYVFQWLRDHAWVGCTTFPLVEDNCSSASIIFNFLTTCACSSSNLANSSRRVSASTWICLIRSRGPPGLSSGVCAVEFCVLHSAERGSASGLSWLRIEDESTSSTMRLESDSGGNRKLVTSVNQFVFGNWKLAQCRFKVVTLIYIANTNFRFCWSRNYFLNFKLKPSIIYVGFPASQKG